MSFLIKALSALVNTLCGSTSESPQEQLKSPHKPEYAPHRPQKHQQQYAGGEYAQYPPVHAPHQVPATKPPHGPTSPPPGRTKKYEDDNQHNQHNEYYRNLRDEADSHGDSMARCFQQSRDAYSAGDGARAKGLSNEGKEHQRMMQELNQKASDWIYVENNRDSGPGEIDLHGLYVKEAIARTDDAIEQAKRRGDREVRLIVGKGVHSNGGAAKIRPAIEDLMRKHSLSANIDPQNAGVLVVEIAGGPGGVGSDEISRRLERHDDGCILM